MSKDAPGAGAPPNAADTDAIFEERPKTIIRLLTVGAYIFSVSFAAIVLSGYYIFLWHPPNSRLIHAHAAHLRADSEMEFLVADTLTETRTNKSNRIEHYNQLNEADGRNRYKYTSSPIKDVTEDDFDENTGPISRSDKGLIKQDTHENKERLQERNGISWKTNAEEIPVSLSEENAESRETNDSMNSIIHNENSTKPGNSTSKRKLSEEDSKKRSDGFETSDSDNTKILKKFFKIL